MIGAGNGVSIWHDAALKYCHQEAASTFMKYYWQIQKIILLWLLHFQCVCFGLLRASNSRQANSLKFWQNVDLKMYRSLQPTATIRCCALENHRLLNGKYENINPGVSYWMGKSLTRALRRNTQNGIFQLSGRQRLDFPDYYLKLCLRASLTLVQVKQHCHDSESNDYWACTF